jgi:maltose alpha-D-glucosyltransferase/alpha-amylase
MAREHPEEPPGVDSEPLWYKDAVIYELHVRAFHDSDGDGIGDFRGLVDKLDYLQDLGVTTLWLLPFYPSPLRDDGYDIADYGNINPIYGSLPDFRHFLREAHRRGLRVITELVINHTSDQHPWFQRARRAKPGTRERDFYVWSDTTDRYKEARIIFKDFEPSNWSWDPVAGAYYWHRFYAHQPDLNFDNPAVHRAIFQVLDFWLGQGIDGLRLDAIPYLYEREGTNCENLPETHTFLRELRWHVDERYKERMLLAEANQWPEDAVAYFGKGDECHMCFHFPVMPRLFMAIRMEDRFPIIDILQQTPPVPDNSQWALFLRNHDELTLEMVTDEDRDYMYRVYAQDPQARINLGIRRRLAPLLGNHRGKIELMNGLLFSLPGTPVIYYGDEIGMGDNIYLGDRNGVRTPMQWNAERNAGFSRANPQRLYLPVIIDPEYNYDAINVEAQQNNRYSLLWWMKHLIALRKRHRAFSRGTIEFLYPDNAKVLAFVRRHAPQSGAPAEGEERILVVANLSRYIQAAELDLSAFKGMVPVEMLGRTPFPPVGESPYFLTLGPYAFYWFLLEPQAVAARPGDGQEQPLPLIKVSGEWADVLHGRSREALETALPAYLRTRRWFCGNGRSIDSVQIRDTVAVPCDGTSAQITGIEVHYTEGDSETYVLPIAFAVVRAQPPVAREDYPQSAICRLLVRGKRNGSAGQVEGVLYDALEERAFAQALLAAIGKRKRFKGTGGELVGSRPPAFRNLWERGQPPPAPAPMKGEQNNTSIDFGGRWLLKVFRRVEVGVNPELELGRFLTDRTPFAHIAPTAGALEYRRGRNESVTVAVLHGYVANEGTAWRYTLDSLRQYYERSLTPSEALKELDLPHRAVLDRVAEEIPRAVVDRIGTYLESARLLGQRTAELHLALASATDDPAFAPEPFSSLYQRSLYQGQRGQTRKAFELLRKHLKLLPEPTRAEAQAIVGREEEVLTRIRAIFERKITAQRLRCHGDYHLAQVLYTGKDFVLIGLEGQIHRPISERRLKRSPLRDVASMLRSFHYAALSALEGSGFRPEDVEALRPSVPFWHRWVSVAFLKGYLTAAAAGSFLPRDRAELAVLLDFYLLKRAINELRYELTLHPQQAKIPLQGLAQML